MRENEVFNCPAWSGVESSRVESVRENEVFNCPASSRVESVRDNKVFNCPAWSGVGCGGGGRTFGFEVPIWLLAIN